MENDIVFIEFSQTIRPTIGEDERRPTIGEDERRSHSSENAFF